MAEVQAHDRAGADGVERPLLDRVRAGIGVVVRIDVEAEDGAVPRLAGHVEHDVGERGGAVVGTGGPEERGGRARELLEYVTAADDLVEHRIARQREERRVSVGVVRELVTGVRDLLRPPGIRVEPVADDERRHHDVVRSEDVEHLLCKVEIAVRVERERDAVAVARTRVDEVGGFRRVRRGRGRGGSGRGGGRGGGSRGSGCERCRRSARLPVAPAVRTRERNESGRRGRGSSEERSPVESHEAT